MKKKIIIVGGGITGCITALYFDKKNFDVSIYEAKNNLGGILSDFSHNDETFLNGVQYLDVNTNWYTKIKKIFGKKLNEFGHNYGSLTDTGNSSIYSDKFAIPVFQNIEINNFKTASKKNLNSRISLYPKKIIDFLNLYLKKLKMQNKIIDNIYAIEKYNFLNNEDFEAALPNEGYNSFFNDFYKILKKNKIKIYLKSKLIPTWDNNNLSLKTSDGKSFSADHIIWTGNPTILIKEIINKKIDAYPIRIVQYSANIEKKVNNFYTQIFSTKSNFLRFFSYNLDNKNKISIESIYDRNENNIKEKINMLLKKINFDYELTNEKIFKNLSVRFNIVTKKDEKIFNELKRKTVNTNLICGPWNIYARNDKIAYLKKTIDNLF